MASPLPQETRSPRGEVEEYFHQKLQMVRHREVGAEALSSVDSKIQK